MTNQIEPPYAGSPLGRPDDPVSTAAEVRRMFAGVARHYDFLNHFLSLGTDILWRRATANTLAVDLARPESVVADLCCGTGDLSLALARRSAGQVVGVDFCHPMLARAREKSAGLPRLAFVEADALRLPFADDRFDAVAVAFGFRNLANYRHGLAEMYRILKPGGTVALLEFSRVRSAVIGPLFRFYFRRILPRLGGWISGDAASYRYLPDSVERFPDQDALVRLMQATGFINVRYRNLSWGVAALHVGSKPR